MGNTKNVLIPITLVKQIIDLLGNLELSTRDRDICDDCLSILQALNVKIQKLELRDAYSKIVAADNEDMRHDARMEYLWQKRRLDDYINDGCIL